MKVRRSKKTTRKGLSSSAQRFITKTAKTELKRYRKAFQLLGGGSKNDFRTN